jgi:hypothetical protein
MEKQNAIKHRIFATSAPVCYPVQSPLASSNAALYIFSAIRAGKTALFDYHLFISQLETGVHSHDPTQDILVRDGLEAGIPDHVRKSILQQDTARQGLMIDQHSIHEHGDLCNHVGKDISCSR